MNRSRSLSPQALVIVDILASHQDWCHGYSIMTEAGVKSGTLYPVLMRLENQGLLEARWEESELRGRPPRHVYRLTQAGRNWVAELSQTRAAPAQLPSPLRTVKARS
jgi:PadR family transcriptional regulator, regulatory protein PadR